MQIELTWTWRTVLISAVSGWLLLLTIFAPGRVCEPFLSTQCVAQAWNYVGDAVWLRGLERWQTLVVTLLAALIGGGFIFQQIRHAEEQERQRISRNMEAARAMLSLSLDALSDYTEKCGRWSNALLVQATSESLEREGLVLAELPAVPMEVASTLQNLILSSDPQKPTPFGALLSKLQILSARLRSTRAALADRDSSHIVLKSNIEHEILNAAEIRAMCNNLFTYARRRTEEIPSSEVDASQLTNALLGMGFHDHRSPSLFETVERYAASNA